MDAPMGASLQLHAAASPTQIRAGASASDIVRAYHPLSEPGDIAVASLLHELLLMDCFSRSRATCASHVFRRRTSCRISDDERRSRGPSATTAVHDAKRGDEAHRRPASKRVA
jgi:hypothetical protein